MLAIIIIISGLNLILIAVLFFRSFNQRGNLNGKFEQLEKNQDKVQQTVKEEISRNRDETSQRGREAREEISSDLEKMREIVRKRLEAIQIENSEKLDKMREIVDEKLHSTLDKRLGESFKRVQDQLESVHKGLGEMQTLASSVGDLKKVLTNVKARGTWGEIQLGALLEQVLM